MAAERRPKTVRLAAEFDPRDVFQIGDVAGRADLDYDALEVLLGVQAALGVDRVLEVQPRRRRLATDNTGRHLDVLRAHRRQDFVHSQRARGHRIWSEPEPHRVVAAADDANLAHALETRQLVSDVDYGVVAQVKSVVTAVFAGNKEHHRYVGRALLRDYADLLHSSRQARQRLLHPVLHLHLCRIEIGA